MTKFVFIVVPLPVNDVWAPLRRISDTEYVDDVTHNLICTIAQLLDWQHSFFSVAVDCFHISVRSGTILPIDGSIREKEAAQETARKKRSY